MPTFNQPSYRAAQSDLAISVSPLGLIELSDEEFEVHGPRLNRYATNWAFYLGHHWGYRREAGESNITFNYTRAFMDYINSFTFGRGVHFKTPKATEAIIPNILDRVWTVDNDKRKVGWRMGQIGGITGDCFVKVAYEDPYVDSSDRVIPGRLRILPMNSNFIFPEWHPHDRERMIRCKIKYRFFGTAPDGTRQVFTYTEILTDDMIEEYINDEMIDQRENPIGRIPIAHIANMPVEGSPWGLADIQDVIPLNREYNEKATDISDVINYHACVDETTQILSQRGWLKHTELTVGDDVLTLNPDTDEIEWKPVSHVNVYEHAGELTHWTNHVDALTTGNHRWLVERRVGRDRNHVRDFARTSEAGAGEECVSDLQQGSRIVLAGGIPTHFPTEAKYTDEFVETVGWWVTEGAYAYPPSCVRPVGSLSQSPSANPTHVESIRRLAAYWRGLGAAFTERPSLTPSGCATWYLGVDVVDALDAVVPGKSLPAAFLTSLTHGQARRLREILVDADGTRSGGRTVWYQDDAGRIDGYQMLSAMLGARTNAREDVRGNGVVSEYSKRHVLAEETISTSEVVPYEGEVWCPTVENEVWFARRNGNTFWTGNSPVTIVTGAKATNLERGPDKVWGGLPENAKVFNLGLDTNLAGPLAFLELLKQSMHEMTGVPAGALGEKQHISNTSGVALAIEYQPLMNRYTVKTMQYGAGLEQINELALLTLAVKEPHIFQWNPTEESDLKPGQYPVLDLADPITYRTEADWEAPLPTDTLIKLNEVQSKMGLGLESKRGALRELGEEFPDEKMAEIFEELREDTIEQGALGLLNAQVAMVTQMLTGFVPGADGVPTPGPEGGDEGDGVQSAGGAGVTSAGAGDPSMGPLPGITTSANPADLINSLNTLAHGTKLAQRRNPSKNGDS